MFSVYKDLGPSRVFGMGSKLGGVETVDDAYAQAYTQRRHSRVAFAWFPIAGRTVSVVLPFAVIATALSSNIILAVLLVMVVVQLFLSLYGLVASACA